MSVNGWPMFKSIQNELNRRYGSAAVFSSFKLNGYSNKSKCKSYPNHSLTSFARGSASRLSFSITCSLAWGAC